MQRGGPWAIEPLFKSRWLSFREWNFQWGMKALNINQMSAPTEFHSWQPHRLVGRWCSANWDRDCIRISQRRRHGFKHLNEHFSGQCCFNPCVNSSFPGPCPNWEYTSFAQMALFFYCNQIENTRHQETKFVTPIFPHHRKGHLEGIPQAALASACRGLEDSWDCKGDPTSPS